MTNLSHRYFDRADGTANNPATIHTPHSLAKVTGQVGGEDTMTPRGSTVTLYRWMLYTATEYADRLIDRRRQNGKNVHKTSPTGNGLNILLVQTSEKIIVK